jgi:hypothetical protein
MIGFLLAFFGFLIVGVTFCGLSNCIKSVERRQNLMEWGVVLTEGSIFPLLLVFLCVL